MRRYTTVRFEALIRDNVTGTFEMHSVYVRYMSGVSYEKDGKTEWSDGMNYTEEELWQAAAANAQPLTCYGQRGTIEYMCRKETTFESSTDDKPGDALDEVRRRLIGR